MTLSKPPGDRRAESRKKDRRKTRPTHCSVPDCGRKSYAQGLCQTHYGQKRTTGKLKPIRPYRARTTGTVKFAGLRLTSTCAGEIARYAAEQNFSFGAAISDVLESWAEREDRK